MRYNKFLILLLSLLLLTGCIQAPQPPQSETDPDDPPSAEQIIPETLADEGVVIEDPVLRFLMQYGSLTAYHRSFLEQEPGFSESLAQLATSEAAFFEAAKIMDLHADKHDIVITQEYLDAINHFEIQEFKYGICRINISHNDAQYTFQFPDFSSSILKNITSLDFFGNLPQLQSLHLAETQTTSLAPLTNLPGLTNLSIISHRLSDLKSLQEMPRLRNLSLTCRNPLDLSPLYGLDHLQSLSLAELPIESLDFLQTLPKLENLVLSGNGLSCVAADFTAHPSLYGLTIMDNTIIDPGTLETHGFKWLYLPKAEDTYDLRPILLQKTAERGIIEDTYFLLTDDPELKVLMEQYNEQTAELYMSYLNEAISKVISLYDLRHSDGEPYRNGPSSVIAFTEKQKLLAAALAEACLYSNPTHHAHSLAQYSAWFDAMHLEYDPSAYFECIDILSAALSETNLSITCTTDEYALFEHITARKTTDILLSGRNLAFNEDLAYYNRETQNSFQYMTDYARLLAELSRGEAHYAMRYTPGTLYFTEKELDFAALAAGYGLYRNPWYFLYRDVNTAQYIAGELGGSGGIWAKHSAPLEAYLSCIERLIKAISE